jgi:hypothetical protein
MRTWLIGLLAILSPALTALADPASRMVWHRASEIAAGSGERGPWRQNESRYDYVDDPSVAIDAQGQVAVAWADQARKAIHFQRFSAQGQPQLARPVDVSRRPETFSWLPRVAIAPDAPQKIFIAWQEIIFSGSHGGEILFARSDDAGRTFSAALNLSNSIGGDGKGRINRNIWHNGSLDLVAGPGGALYAAWTEYDGPLWFSRSLDGGRSFSRPWRVAGSAASPARAPSLALGPDRALYLAWALGEDWGADIHLAKSLDGGRTFGEPVVVAPSKTYSDAPKLAVDPVGVLHLAYAESSGGPFKGYHVRHTRSTDGGRTFQPSRDISSPPPGPFTGAAFPSLGVDARGRVVVAWELYGGERQPPRGLGIAVSIDGGRGFSQPALVPDSADPGGGFNGSSQGLLMRKLAVNPAGAVAIVNSSFKADAHSRVWLLRGSLPR